MDWFHGGNSTKILEQQHQTVGEAMMERWRMGHHGKQAQWKYSVQIVPQHQPIHTAQSPASSLLEISFRAGESTSLSTVSLVIGVFQITTSLLLSNG